MLRWFFFLLKNWEIWPLGTLFPHGVEVRTVVGGALRNTYRGKHGHIFYNLPWLPSLLVFARLALGDTFAWDPLLMRLPMQ